MSSDPIALIEGLLTAGHVEIVPRLSTSVYDDLVNSGRFNYLQEELRRGVADYYTFPTIVQRGVSDLGELGGTLGHTVARHVPGELDPARVCGKTCSPDAAAIPSSLRSRTPNPSRPFTGCQRSS